MNKGSIVRNNTVWNDPGGDTIVTKAGVRNAEVSGNTVHLMPSYNRGIVLGGNTDPQWDWDPTTAIEAYDSSAYNNTVINETGTSSPYALGLVGTLNCTLKDNIMQGGGQVFEAKGGPYLGTPAPMPVGSTITNNVVR